MRPLGSSRPEPLYNPETEKAETAPRKHNYPEGETKMRKFGIVLIITGAIWGAVAFNMKTSVETESRTIGSGIYSLNIPSQTIHNLDLADQRRNHLIGAGVLFISGILLFGFGSIKTVKEAAIPDNGTTYRKVPISRRITANGRCPLCEEVVSNTAMECAKCGQTLKI